MSRTEQRGELAREIERVVRKIPDRGKRTGLALGLARAFPEPLSAFAGATLNGEPLGRAELMQVAGTRPEYLIGLCVIGENRIRLGHEIMAQRERIIAYRNRFDRGSPGRDLKRIGSMRERLREMIRVCGEVDALARPGPAPAPVGERCPDISPAA